MLFYNGEIITADAQNTVATAMVIKKNKIVYIGDAAGAEFFNCKGIVDLQGRAVVPGFCDAHCHVVLAGVQGRKPLSAINAVSLRELLEALQKETMHVPKGEWIQAEGYNQEQFTPAKHPTRWDIDQVVPDHPVMLVHVSGHLAVYNTKALELCGFFESQDDFPQAFIEYENGKPTGLFRETAHFRMMQRANFEYPDSEVLNSIQKVTGILKSYGITMVHDAGAYGGPIYRALQKAEQRGQLDVCFYPMFFSCYGKEAQIKTAQTAIENGYFTGFGTENLKMGCLKIMIDGSSSAGTCATRAPLAHNHKTYPLSFEREEIDKVVLNGHKAGFQITAHAIGDQAVEAMLDAYEKAQEQYPRKDARHRIEHCMITQPDLIMRIKKLGIIPVANPLFIHQWGQLYQKYFGSRSDYVFPMQSYLKAGIPVAVGSDFPAGKTLSPFESIAAMMDREVLNHAEDLSVLQAIRCYTYNGAYASFSERERGSLEVGKRADFAVLNDSILNKSAAEIRKLKVQQTFYNGIPVYMQK